MSSRTSRQEATRGSRDRPIGGSGRVSACSAAAAPPPPGTCSHESTFGSERRGPSPTSMPAARRSASVRLAVTEGGDSVSSCAAVLASSSERLLIFVSSDTFPMFRRAEKGNDWGVRPAVHVKSRGK